MPCCVWTVFFSKMMGDGGVTPEHETYDTEKLLIVVITFVNRVISAEITKVPPEV